MRQRIGDAEEIHELHVCRRHSGLPSPKIHRDRIWILELHDPEQSIRVGVNARVEVMDLRREIGEVVPTPIEVQSNECESSLMNGAVLSDVDASGKPHVRVEQQRFRAAVRVGGLPASLNIGDTHEAVEVGQT